MTLDFQAIDDEGVPSAVTGLLQTGGSWRAGSLVGLERIGGYLSGGWDPPIEVQAPERVGHGEWTALIGRIGAIALRAATPSTPAEHRERLLALLEVWSESVFVDADARWRVGNVSEPSVFRPWIRDEHGATIRLFPYTGGMRVLEFRRGAAAAPGLGPLTDVVESPRGGWGAARQIRELIALVRTRGPMPWDPGAVARLVDGTGISRAAAVLLLAANPGTRSSPEPFPDREERQALGLTDVEAKLAAAELHWLIDTERLDLFADALPADPGELWAPDGPKVVADRIAAVWRTLRGHPASVPEASRALIAALKPKTPAAELCTVLAHPSGDPLVSTDRDTWPHASIMSIGLVDDSSQGDEPRRMERLLQDVAGWCRRCTPNCPPATRSGKASRP
ncbi:hypothetical protein B4N89_45570 [Embleya scabrispora]|uniref:Uncharacterized protein n=1 Tax=Embleya scabrispora TaxID=159449 RepID=A0A1T3NJ49_9ACTN|nr:hypothetical protein [Embleya scabrispora]OPC76755.1 hypothetical protein B4N89_45570 [Embleya scabrispora]